MSAEFLVMCVAVILSLFFSYFPGAEGWFKSLEATTKRLIMLGLLVVVTVGAFGLACTGYGSDFGLVLECSKTGAIGLLQVLFAAVVANQSAFLISPKT